MIDVADYNFAIILMTKEPNIYKEHQRRRLFPSALSEQLCLTKMEKCWLTELND